MSNTLRSMRSKSRRFRRDRIHIGRGAHYQPSSLTWPLMWGESPPVQERSRLEAGHQEVEATEECQVKHEQQALVAAQRTVDQRDARQFAREATRRESAAVTKYGMAAYDREELRRDERGRILR
jgi:hypothetical protein